MTETVVVKQGTLKITVVDGVRGVSSVATQAYVHTQVAAAATWIIAHNLGYRPNVTVIEDGTNMAIDTDTAYTDLNNLSLTFAAPVAGVAYLS